jgi:hypothetical protein
MPSPKIAPPPRPSSTLWSIAARRELSPTWPLHREAAVSSQTGEDLGAAAVDRVAPRSLEKRQTLAVRLYRRSPSRPNQFARCRECSRSKPAEVRPHWPREPGCRRLPRRPATAGADTIAARCRRRQRCWGRMPPGRGTSHSTAASPGRRSQSRSQKSSKSDSRGWPPGDEKRCDLLCGDLPQSWRMRLGRIAAAAP